MDGQKTMAPIDAERAVYVDFEGCRNEGPTLLGWAYRSAHGRVMLDQVVVEHS
jgi:hypothetical protein